MGGAVGAGVAVGDGVDVTVIVAVGARTGASVAVGTTPLQAKIPRDIIATPPDIRSFSNWPSFQTRKLTVLE